MAAPTSPCMRRMRSQCSASDWGESAKRIAVPARASTRAASSERGRSGTSLHLRCPPPPSWLHAYGRMYGLLLWAQRSQGGVELVRRALAQLEAAQAVRLIGRVEGVLREAEAAHHRGDAVVHQLGHGRYRA